MDNRRMRKRRKMMRCRYRKRESGECKEGDE